MKVNYFIFRTVNFTVKGFNLKLTGCKINFEQALEEYSRADLKISSGVPGFPTSHIEVSLGKRTNPTL